MNIPDVFFENLVSLLVVGLKILILCYADPDPGSYQPWIRDRRSQIRFPGSATLHSTMQH